MNRNSIARFEQIARASLREVGHDPSVIDNLLGEARDLGLSDAEAVGVIESLVAASALTPPAEIVVAHDHGIANAGVAGGTTLIVFRVSNASPRSLESIVVHVKDPESGLLVSAPRIDALPSGAHRETEVTLALTRIGKQSIRTGFIEVIRVSGETTTFRLTDPILLTADNSSSVRMNVQTINQTIQTHGGGVVSTGDLNTSGTLPGDGSQGGRWTSLRIAAATDSDREEFLSLCVETALADDLDRTRKAEAVLSESVPATPLPIPAAPDHLIATPQSPTSVLLTWTDHATNEDGTHVERGADGFGFTLLATLGPDVTSYLVTGLTPGSRCAFRVRAFNAHGTSPYSNVASTLLPELPKETPAPLVQPPIQVIVSAPAPSPSTPDPVAASTGSQSTTLFVNVISAFVVIGCLVMVFQWLGFAFQ